MDFIKAKSRHPAAVPATANRNNEGRNGEKREEGDLEEYALDTIG